MPVDRLGGARSRRSRSSPHLAAYEKACEGSAPASPRTARGARIHAPCAPHHPVGKQRPRRGGAPLGPNRRIQRDDLLSQWGPAEGDEPLDVCALQISRA